MTDADALVVGAGPAGSAAAAALARAGWRTVVLEKDAFPRRKVCGAFLAAGARARLERLGAAGAVDAAGPERIDRAAVHFSSGPSVRFALPAPALGISRFALDDLLARNAAAAGAAIRFHTRATSVTPFADGFGVTLPDGDTIRSRVVIGAWGRWDALDRSLERGFGLRRARWLGWSGQFQGESGWLSGQVRLYVFRGGYCGLSRVEGGRVNLAGVLSEAARRRAGGSWEGVVAAARRENAGLDADLRRLELDHGGYLGTGPVFFTAKPPVESGILMAGDAAGVLDPYSGEGQATALASGLLVGEMAARCLAGDLSPAALPQRYLEAWRERFARPFAWNAAFRGLLLHPALGALGARVAGERLARFALARIYTPLAPSGVKIPSSSLAGR